MSRVWMCVRCGVLPRWNGAYLCEPCYYDPQQAKEVSEAIEHAESKTTRRNYLIATFHWHGRWQTGAKAG